MILINTPPSYFHKNSFHYFKDSFNDDLDPRVRYMHEHKLVCHFRFSFPQMGLVAFEVFIVKILNQMLIFVPTPWNGLNLKQFVYESLKEKKLGVIWE